MLHSLFRSIRQVATAPVVASCAARTCASLNGSSSLRNFSAQPPKTVKYTEMVLLMDVNGKMLGQHTKTEAEALAKKMRLTLVPINEDVSGAKRKTFQLVRYQDPKLSDSGKTKKADVEVKSMQMTTSIADHDMQTKAKQIRNWLAKGCEVRVMFVGEMSTKSSVLESLFKRFEKLMTDAPPHQINQKIIRSPNLRFTIVPLHDKAAPKTKVTSPKVKEVQPEAPGSTRESNAL